MAITPVTVDNFQQIEAEVSGPRGANRLFIFTGVAKFDFKGDGANWKHDFVEFELGPVFNPGQVLDTNATASLNSIKNDRESQWAGWAVDKTTARWDSTERRIKLRADLAVKDTDGFIQRIGFQVNVLARI